MEQKIKQDEIFIGKNIRRIRKERGRTFAKDIIIFFKFGDSSNAGIC